MPISTVGYEGAAIEDFLALLTRVNIDVLVDIRDLPLSRKKGFSKNALRAALNHRNIEYLHLKALGDPKEGRDAARRGDFKRFNIVFRNHLSLAEALNDLRMLANMSQEKHICLMCFERDHKICHRNIVVEHLCDICDIEVTHFGVPSGIGRKEAA